jgi:hypothetical protein
MYFQATKQHNISRASAWSGERMRSVYDYGDQAGNYFREHFILNKIRQFILNIQNQIFLHLAGLSGRAV